MLTINTAGAMESEEEEEHGPCEWFGLRRIPLKPGTASGYLGVQRTKSKKRPWQATVSRPGKKRVDLGSFKKPIEAAVARAEAKASGVHLVPSPRKQAPRNSGSELCPPPVTLHHPVISILMLSCSTRADYASQAIDGSHDPAHAARHLRERLNDGSARGSATERRSRARCKRRSLYSTMRSMVWRAADRPATSAGPFASGCGSIWPGLACPVA